MKNETTGHICNIYNQPHAVWTIQPYSQLPANFMWLRYCRVFANSIYIVKHKIFKNFWGKKIRFSNMVNKTCIVHLLKHNLKKLSFLFAERAGIWRKNTLKVYTFIPFIIMIIISYQNFKIKYYKNLMIQNVQIFFLESFFLTVPLSVP